LAGTSEAEPESRSRFATASPAYRPAGQQAQRGEQRGRWAGDIGAR